MDVRTFFSNMSEAKLEKLYLFHGDEEYGKQKAVEALERNLDSATRDFNFDIVENASASEITELASTLPMMSNRKIVLCKDTPAFKKSDEDGEILKHFFDKIPQKTTLVFFERGKTDQRKMLYKAINKAGNVVLFDYYSPGDAVKWIMSFAKERDKTLSNAVAIEIVNMTGVELNNLSDEMSKLCAYCEKEIDIVSVKNIVKPMMEHSVFEMLEQFIAGKNLQAFEKLNHSLEMDGVGAAMQLLSFFGSRFRNMLIASRVLEKGGGAQAAVKLIGGNAYAAKKSVEAARKFNLKQLENATLFLYQADRDIKSGRKGAKEALQDTLMQIFVNKK